MVQLHHSIDKRCICVLSHWRNMQCCRQVNAWWKTGNITQFNRYSSGCVINKRYFKPHSWKTLCLSDPSERL